MLRIHSSVILLAALLAACASAKPPAREAAPKVDAIEAKREVVISALAEGVWLHASYKEIAPWGLVLSHGLIVEDGASAILIDTAWDDEGTHRIMDWARDTLEKPITRAVFTHAHEDKMGGVKSLRERGVETFAAPDSNTLASANGLSPAEFEVSFDANGRSEQLSPVIIFDPGAGHTTDNIVVAIPARGILFGGCLVRPGESRSLGNTADADIAHWDIAIEQSASQFPDATIVIPSHGAPGGRELLDHTIALVRAHRAKDNAE